MEEIDFFDKVSRNARLWADKLHEQVLDRRPEDRPSIALARIQKDGSKIIRQHLRDALTDHPEYSKRTWMSTELLPMFNQLGIIRVNPTIGKGKIDLYDGAEELVGDMDD